MNWKIICISLILICCSSIDANPILDDSTLIEKILTAHFAKYKFVIEKKGYTVISPTTNLPEHMLKSDLGKIIWPKVNDESIDDLIENLLLKNKEECEINIKSSQSNGYIIDYDLNYEKYFYKNGGGWEQWYIDHPNAYGYTSISLPFYDKERNLIIIYIGTQDHWLAGAGGLVIFQLVDNELVEIEWIGLWVS
jgi:hypothetical protein